MQFSVEWMEKLASTNAFMRDRHHQGPGLKSGQIVAAREQTAGRGRQNRKWLSAPDRNLCFSLFVSTGAPVAAVPSLTMAVALAVNDLLRDRGIRSHPKWPNDVLVEDKKICGILSERMERTKGMMAGIIVGVGLNVNMDDEEAGAIDRPATSVLIESGRAIDPATLLEDLLDPLDDWIGKWERGGFAGIRDVWTEKAGPIGKTLAVHDGDVKKSGTLAGYGDHGELLLQTAAGIETIWSGDVS